MIEFDCCECGTRVVAVTLKELPEPPLCANCEALPNWHEDPVLRRMLGGNDEEQHQ